MAASKPASIGIWVHSLLYSGPEEQPLAASLDAIQELGAEISDTLFDLWPSDDGSRPGSILRRVDHAKLYPDLESASEIQA